LEPRMTPEPVPRPTLARRFHLARWLPPLLAVILVGFVVARSRRPIVDHREAHRVAAGRYDEYAKAYQSFADHHSIPMSTCYGQKWDSYSNRVWNDIQSHARDKAYIAGKAALYDRLRRQSEQAAAGPSLPDEPDPPPP
jgi:hypothetical protein